MEQHSAHFRVHTQNRFTDIYRYSYNRTPLIRPPSDSHWCGRIRGMVVREGLDYFPGCTCLTLMYPGTHIYGLHTAMHNSIVHTENSLRDVPVAVAYRGKRSDQATTMFSGTSALSPFNTERRRPTFAAFSKTRIQKPSFKY